jgi:hypothetical protein
LDVLAITITFGNTLAPSAYSNLLKIYASLAKELQSDPAAKERYARLGAASGKKTILAKGAEGPVEGEKDLAAYFVRPPHSNQSEDRTDISHSTGPVPFTSMGKTDFPTYPKPTLTSPLLLSKMGSCTRISISPRKKPTRSS